MRFSPTAEQLAIAEHIAARSGSTLASALAGSAKTTTIEFAAREVNSPALAIAFNTKIKDELVKRLPTNFEVLTFNSAGHRAWARYISKKLIVDDKKVYKLSHFMGQGEPRRQAMKLVGAAKALGLVPDGLPPKFKPAKVFLPDTDESWGAVIALTQLEELEDDVLTHAAEILKESIRVAFEGTIDFADQVYMSCCFGGTFPQAADVFVDELQDISEMNLYQIRRMTLRRAHGFGDEKQAIYAWRGASTNMMERFRETFKAVEFGLNTCFRCSQAVVEEAKEFAPRMVSAPWAPKGSVTALGEWSLDDIDRDSVVLCRNNSPLFALGFAFLASGRPVNFHGKDLGWQIAKEIKSLSGGNNIFKTTLIELLNQKIERSEEAARERLVDILEIINAIPGEDTDALTINLTALLNAPSGDVTLCSIHGSKGLEWEKVYFLDRWRIPSKYAVTSESIQQEWNLYYVCVTRAKLDLVYINFDGFRRSGATARTSDWFLENADE